MLNLDIFPSEMLRGCLVCVICNANSIHYFIFKLCIMTVNTSKMSAFYLCTFCEYFYILGGLELRYFSLEMLRWFLVCVICNSKKFHSLIVKLCIMIVHTLIMCLPFLYKFDKYFLILGLLNLDIFSHLLVFV